MSWILNSFLMEKIISIKWWNISYARKLTNILIYQKLNSIELDGRINFKAEFQVKNKKIIKKVQKVLNMLLCLRFYVYLHYQFWCMLYYSVNFISLLFALSLCVVGLFLYQKGLINIKLTNFWKNHCFFYY